MPSLTPNLCGAFKVMFKRYFPRVASLGLFLFAAYVTYLMIQVGHVGAALCAGALAAGLGVVVAYDGWRTWLELKAPSKGP